MSEHQEQVALFRWADRAEKKYPQLRKMYAIPNGGKRAKKTAVDLKHEGVKSGVPDIHLPVARGEFHGLYIELKKPKDHLSREGRPTKNQLTWLSDLADEDYMAVMCIGWDKAKETLEQYLALPPYG